MTNLQRVRFFIEAIKQPAGTPGRSEAIAEVVRLAMKADTLDLLDQRGLVPKTMSYREPRDDSRGSQSSRNLEGD